MNERLPNWPMYQRVWRREQLFDLMIRALDIDMSHAVRIDGGEAFFLARTHCLDCVHATACRKYMADEGDISAPLDFCLNASYFARCRRAP